MPMHFGIMGRFSPWAMRSLVALAFAASASLALAADEKAIAPASSKDASEHAPVVTVMTVRPQMLEDWRVATGTLEAVATPTVAAEVAGRIKRVLVDEGDAITAGQPLALIDDADYRIAVARAEAQLAQAEALLRGARLKLERLERLVRTDSAPRSSLDDARAAYDALKAQRDVARAALDQARRQLARTIIRSPVNGRVGRRFVSQGDYIAPGRPAFALIATDRLRARLPFAEILSTRLKTGLPVRLENPADPDHPVRAKITRISPAVDAASRAVFALVTFDNIHAWRPGASIIGRVRIRKVSAAILVPRPALVLRANGAVVFVLNADRVRAVPVKTGISTETGVEILSGLKGGERIVVDGAGFLTDGMKVRLARQGAPRS